MVSAARLILIRGINVGGKNAVSMVGLAELLEELGCTRVSTFLNSGNAIADSKLPADKLARALEQALPSRFALDDELLKVLVLTAPQLRAVIDKRPPGFGDEPGKYHSDAIFLMDIPASEALKVFDPRDGVDAVWPGDGVIYSRRLSAQRTKSRLGKIVGTPAYKSMTIRSWSTMLKLAARLDEHESVE